MPKKVFSKSFTKIKLVSVPLLRLKCLKSQNPVFPPFWSPPWLTQGLLNRWTSQYDWGITAGGLTFNLNNGTKTPLIIVKNLENTFLGMKKVRAWPILTLAMPYVKTEQIQNLALFWDCCKGPKSATSGNLSKKCHVWATQWPTSS